MTMPDADELIHAVLDDEASPDQKARLQELAARSPDVREEFEAVRQLFADLKAAGQTEVPAGLAENVLRELRRRPRPPAPVRAFEPARARRRNLFVAGWAAAAILAIVVAWPLVRPAIDDPAVSSGAMVDRETGWSEVARAVTPSGSMSATLRRNGDAFSIEASLRSPGSVRIAWTGGIAPRAATAGPEMTVACPEQQCQAAGFVRTSGAAATVHLTSPEGETLDVAIP